MRNVRRGRSPFVVVPIAIGLAAGLVWFVQRTEDTDWRPPRPGDDQQETVDSEQAASTTAPSLAAGPPDQAALDALELRVEPVAGIENPTAVVEHPATGDLYIAAVAGAIVRVPGDGGSPAPVADLSGQISASGESGLLDIAFDAGGDLLYVSLVASGGDLTLVEIPVSTDGLATERARTLLTVTSPTNVHHAGDVDVDAAGLVWYAVGDGGPSQAYNTRAQDLTDLHGKILRIDPRPAAGAAYQIPPDNPFAGRSDVRPEIWAYGLRNPWRFELDPVTSDLWIGDVGRNGPEEINHLPGPQAGAGANLVAHGRAVEHARGGWLGAERQRREELQMQRARRPWLRLRQAGDARKAGPGSGGHHGDGGLPLHDEAPGMDGLAGAGMSGHALTREGRRVERERVHHVEPQICRHGRDRGTSTSDVQLPTPRDGGHPRCPFRCGPLG